MKIAVLEKTNFNNEQIEKLMTVGDVDFYDSLSQEQANDIAPGYDIVIVNWLDPTPFLLKMKSGSLVALLSTGYGWISNLEQAREKNISVANLPGFSTEAVAEHLLGLLLGVSKNILESVNTNSNSNIGFELKGKTIGIIGLGRIGSRFAEIMNYFGADVLTYNRTPKNSNLAKDVSLDELMEKSDVICVTCSVNDDSKSLINIDNYKRLKQGVVIIGSTWDVISEDAIINGIKEETIGCVSFDAATEGSEIVSNSLKGLKNRLYLTPHIAYNTVESEKRQLDICVDNILSFANGNQKNIVN